MTQEATQTDEQAFKDGFDEAVNELNSDDAPGFNDSAANDGAAVNTDDNQPHQGTQDQNSEDQNSEDHQPPDGKEGETKDDGNGQAPNEEDSYKHKYSSLLGRHQKLQSEHQVLQQQYQAPEPGDDPDNSPETDLAKKADIPESLKEDVREFKEKHSDYAALIESDSKDGEALRSILEEYGPDVAVLKAENMMLNSKVDLIQKDFSKKERTQQTAAIEHERKVLMEAHPDFVDLASTPEKAEEYAIYKDKVVSWVASLPYRDAADKMRIVSTGSPSEVSALLTDFKKSNAQQNNSDGNRKSKVNNALAVPSKKANVPKGNVDKNDFSAGFSEAVREIERKKNR